MIPSVLLLIPPGSSMRFTHWVKEHLGINYIAASLRKEGITTEIVPLHIPDYMTENQLIAVLKRQSPVVGITVSQAALGQAMHLISIAKQYAPRSQIVLGGHFPTIASKPVLDMYLPEADYLVQGEGELAMVNLVSALLNNRQIENSSAAAVKTAKGWSVPQCRAAIPDINLIPFAGRDYTESVIRYNPQLAILGSRGCLGKCRFCSVSKFYSNHEQRHWRGREPESIIEEMRQLSADFGINHFEFRDDCLIGGTGEKAKTRIHALCGLMEKTIPGAKFSAFINYKHLTTDIVEHLAAGGMYSCLVGVESVSPDMAKHYGKSHNKEHLAYMLRLLHEKGVAVRPTMLPNSPYSTLETLKEDFEFIKTNCIPLNYFPMFEYFTPFEGTPLCDQLREDGLLVENDISRRPHGYAFRDSRAALFARLGITATRFVVRPCADRLFISPDSNDRHRCNVLMDTLTKTTEILFQISSGQIPVSESIGKIALALDSLTAVFEGYDKNPAIEKFKQQLKGEPESVH